MQSRSSRSSRSWTGRCVIVAAGLVAALTALPLAAQSGQQPAKPQAAPQMSGADMAEMMKTAAPGEHHKRLNEFVGHWTTHTKMWMAPGQPAMESDGTMDADWIMGGRYLVAHHKGIMMGMPFEGQEIDGYDNLSGKYVQSWIDNMGTGIISLSGSCDDAACKSVTTSGEMTDPMTKEKGIYKSVTTYLGPGSFKYESYWVANGNSTKMMEMTGTRQK